jgi:hypothetical protein
MVYRAISRRAQILFSRPAGFSRGKTAVCTLQAYQTHPEGYRKKENLSKQKKIRSGNVFFMLFNIVIEPFARAMYKRPVT